MKKLFKSVSSVVLVGLSVFVLSGCSQKVTLQSVEKPVVNVLKKDSKIFVGDFGKELGVAQKVKAVLAEKSLNDLNDFKVMGLKDADVVFDGQVVSNQNEDGYYRDHRRQCIKFDKNGNCLVKDFRHTLCETRRATLTIHINIVDTKTKESLYSDSVSERYVGDTCFDGYVYTEQEANNYLVDKIVRGFIDKVSSKYVKHRIVILDKLDVDVDSEMKSKFQGALEFIEAQRFDRGREILTELSREADLQKSYVIFYNLGVLAEMKNDYKGAKSFYVKADGFTSHPVEEINAAVIRVGGKF